jgi:hypothetical protein
VLRASRTAHLLTKCSADPLARLGRGARVIGGPLLGAAGKALGGLGTVARKFPILPIGTLLGGSALMETAPRVRAGLSATNMNARLFGRPGPYIPGM